MERYSMPLTLCNLAIILTVMVIFMGGWTRIMDAGLGCPDWPGCFGQLIVPSAPEQIELAEQRFAGQVVDQHKGWLEMIHRYLAAMLGVLITGLALIGWQNRHISGYPQALSFALLVLVIVQGVFGMWTVTLKLLPQVVTAHLFGGLLTLTLLTVLRQRVRGLNRQEKVGRSSLLMKVAVVVLFLQIILGGWTSANYAGWSCNHWFSCLKERPVELDYRGGFSFYPGDGVNYQGGVLNHGARAAIQMTHRAGALVTAVVMLYVVVISLQVKCCTRAALTLAGLMVLQVVIGIVNAVLGIPVLLALLHHATAVLLLLSLLFLKNRYEMGADYG